MQKAVKRTKLFTTNTPLVDRVRRSLETEFCLDKNTRVHLMCVEVSCYYFQ